MKMPPCPLCASNKKVTPQSGWYYCAKCNGLFDSDPNEGGTHHNSDPSRRLEREESRTKRPQQRK